MTNDRLVVVLGPTGEQCKYLNSSAGTVQGASAAYSGGLAWIRKHLGIHI